MSSARDCPLSAIVEREMLSASLIQAGRKHPAAPAHSIENRPIPQLSVFLHIRPGRLTTSSKVVTTVQIHLVKLQGAAVVAFKT